MQNRFRYFNSSPEVIRLAVMLYIRYPLSLRQVEDILFERGIDICYETVRYGWNRFGPLFAAELRTRRIHHGSYSNWRWHLDEVFVRVNGEIHYLRRAVDHEGEVLEGFATKQRDRKAALRFLKRAMKRYGRPKVIVTDRLKSYRAAMNVICNAAAQTCGQWLNNRAETHTSRSGDGKGQWPGSGTSRPCRNLLPPTPRSTIISTRNVIFIIAKPSNSIAPPLWPSGVDL